METGTPVWSLASPFHSRGKESPAKLLAAAGLSCGSWTGQETGLWSRLKPLSRAIPNSTVPPRNDATGVALWAGQVAAQEGNEGASS
jgi:hypothetical protein